MNLSVQVYLRKSYHTILNIILYIFSIFLGFPVYVGFDFITIEISVLDYPKTVFIIIMQLSMIYRLFISRKRENPKPGQDVGNRKKLDTSPYKSRVLSIRSESFRPIRLDY